MSETEMRERAIEHARNLEQECETISRLIALGERGEDAGWALAEELESEPLAIEKICTIRVTLGTGGPARGVDFDVDNGQMVRARSWHQDWFEEKGYADLDDTTAEHLWDAWCSYYEGRRDEW